MKLAKFKLEIKDNCLLFTKIYYNKKTKYDNRLITIDTKTKKVRYVSNWSECRFRKNLITIQFGMWGSSGDAIICGLESSDKFFNFSSMLENVEYKIFPDIYGTVEDYYKLIVTAFKVLGDKVVLVR